jgi:ribosomal protein S18 acetylase RimI-like enzyme
MVDFRESPVDAPSAHALLAEYFAVRAGTFPVEMGTYHTAFPDPTQFVGDRGVFLVVEDVDLSGEPADVGCGGIRRISLAAPAEEPELADVFKPAETHTMEVKHLWLKPYLRGRGLGRVLLTELERRAREFGATQVVLDTNASLEAAGGLYRSSGYVEIAPYNDNPNATSWFGKSLGP